MDEKVITGKKVNFSDISSQKEVSEKRHVSEALKVTLKEWKNVTFPMTKKNVTFSKESKIKSK